MVDLKQECEDALASRLSLDSVGSTLVLADKHKCSGLKEKCEQFLVENLRADCVASSLLLADTHKCNHLKEAALKFCSTQTDFIMKDKVMLSFDNRENTLLPILIGLTCYQNCPHNI